MTSVYTEMGKRTGIEAADSLRHSLRNELDKRVKESELMMKASFFHPSFNILYSRMDPSRFEVVKEKVRRELDNIRPRNNTQVQQEQQRSTNSLTNALLELVAMQDGNNNANANAP
ncbi:hypothetical protein BGX29_005523, partial [Mortierella sp. GBA35]